MGERPDEDISKDIVGEIVGWIGSTSGRADV
jgi:hypothetical protein